MREHRLLRYKLMFGGALLLAHFLLKYRNVT
jgi:hypothetical protein